MFGASEPWDVEALERELQRLLDLPEVATRAGAEPALAGVRRRLAWQWQRRLIVDRNANSDATQQATAERLAREASIFDDALAQLLPLGALLSRVEARLERTTQSSARSPIDPIAAGLQALATADLLDALRYWSSAGDPYSAAAAVRAEREALAQRLLQQAAARFADGASLIGDAERAELHGLLRSNYLEPARRVGTELQRDRAKQLGAALDLLLAPGAAPPVRPEHVPPPPRPRRSPAPAVHPPVASRARPATSRIRRCSLLATLAGVAVLLLALFAWALPSIAGRTAAVASRPALVVSTPQIIELAEATLIATVAPSATPTEQPTATPRPSPRPTATLPPQIVAVEPAELFVGALPAELRLRGADLDRIANVQLLSEGQQPIPLEIAHGSAGELVLRLAALPEPIAGTVEATLAVDGDEAQTPPIVLRDFKAVLTVAGVRQEYAYSGRILPDGGGVYTTIHPSADATTASSAPLRNGEQVEVLRDDVAGWYGVRIRVANDPAQSGKTGWIERWLVDDARVPDEPEPTPAPTPRATVTARPTPLPEPSATPTPRPQPTARPMPRPTAVPLRTFVAEVISSFPDSGSSGGRDSCVQGIVRARGGTGVGAAAVAVNNGDAEVGTLTNGAGEYRICGLGDSTWSVLLRFVPGEPPLANEAVATVYLNGSSEQVAVVDFSER